MFLISMMGLMLNILKSIYEEKLYIKIVLCFASITAFSIATPYLFDLLSQYLTL